MPLLEVGRVSVVVPVVVLAFDERVLSLLLFVRLRMPLNTARRCMIWMFYSCLGAAGDVTGHMLHS